MRTKSTAYESVRLSTKTAPIYFARFFHVPYYGSGAEYEFQTDFASGVVLNQTRNKLLLLEDISGAFAQVFPEQGRASIGAISITLTNSYNLALYFMSAVTLHTAVAMTPTDPAPGQFMYFQETIGIQGSGFPYGGTLDITHGGPVVERVKYIGALGPTNQLEVVQRGADGTVASAHGIGAAAMNGEQIRPGQRCQIYAGYEELDEADYMPFMKMEVVGRKTHQNGQAFIIELADIQRTLRRQVFLTASSDLPVTLGPGNPYHIALQVLTSTGTGTNGGQDVLPATSGLGIPQAYVDSAAFNAAYDNQLPPHFRFRIQSPVVAKDWLETEIFRPLNVYPYVTQNGLYSVRRYGGFR